MTPPSLHAPRNATTAPARVVTGLALAVLLAALGTSVANVALPELAVSFGVPVGQTQWVVLAYLLAMTATAVTVGRLGDRLGRQRILTYGLLLFLAATLACALAPTFWALIAARAAQGVGGAVLMALPLALARDLVPAARLGTAMGLLGTTSALGTALGPAGGGILLGAFGWPALFLAILPFGAAALLLVRGHFPQPATAQGAEDSDGQGVRNLLRRGPLGAGLAMNVLVSTVMMSTLIVGPFFLATGLGLSSAGVGFAMSLGPLVAVATGLIAGRAVDAIGAPRSISVGLGVMLIGTAALAVLPPLMGLPGYLTAIAALTPGYQLFLAANNAKALVGVPSPLRGAAAGLLGLSRNLGLITGASLMGGIYAAVAAAFGRPADAAAFDGAQVTFTAAALLVCCALAIAITQSHPRRENRVVGVR